MAKVCLALNIKTVGKIMHKQNQLFQVTFQPIFYFFLLFLSGIFLENKLDFSLRLLIISLLINLLVTISCYWIKPNHKLISLSLLTGFLLVGGLLGKIEQEKNSYSIKIVDKEVYSNFHNNQQIEIYGEVLSYPKLTPNNINVDIRTDFISRSGRSIKLTTQVQLTIWIKDNYDHRHINLTPGTVIYVLAELAPQQKFKNPGMIDTRQLLIQKGYDFAVSIKNESSLEILYKKTPSFVSTSIYNVQRYLLTRIEENFTPEKAGVLKAIILGNDNYLDSDISERFRVSGLYHILVISGSHIAFLTWFLYRLVRLITRNHWLQFLTIGLFIWTYSLITGAEPPIMRAVLMATVVLSAALWYRQTNASNNIGIAGLILLAYHPNALFEASFQLTFLAVTLILLLVIPLVETLAKIGKWYPTSQTPYPPDSLPLIKSLAELLFWSEKSFIKRQKESQIKYKLEKNLWAKTLEKYRVQAPLRVFSIMLITSIVVQLGLLPFSAVYFHRIVFIGMVLNIISEVLMSILFIISMLFIIVDYISNYIGYYIANIVNIILTLFIDAAWPNICNILNNKLFILSYRVADFSIGQEFSCILYFICILVIIVKIHNWQPFVKPTKLVFTNKNKQRKYIFNIFLAIVITINLLVIILPKRFFQIFLEKSTNRLEVVFLDVGQGDAIFIKFPKGTTMMIDSGGTTAFTSKNTLKTSRFSIGEQVDSMYLWSRGLEHLDYILVTHPHSDHIEGFNKVIKNFSIGQAIVPIKVGETDEWQNFITTLKSSNIPINTWSRGDLYFIDGVKIEVLWPSQETIIKETVSNKMINNESLVLRLDYQGHNILLTGDIERETEEVLVSNNDSLLADVLKAPHHGSKTSSSKNFLEKIDPTFTIISAPEKSRFNHPHLEVVQRYKDLGVKTYQTGLSGAITVYIEDRKLHIQEFASPTLLDK